MPAWAITLVVEIIKWLFGSAKPKMVEAEAPGQQEDTMRARLKKEGWIIGFILITCVSMTGCDWFTRTVYVPSGKAVRLRQDVQNVKVWVKTKDGETIPGSMTLKEGWFVLPVEPTEDNNNGAR